MSLLTGRRALLRLAARDARRHKGRSALVVVMVALPVLVLSAVDVVARTEQAGTGVVDADEPTGEVDALVQVFGGRVEQDPAGAALSYFGDQAPGTVDPEQVRRDLGATRVLPEVRSSSRFAATDGSRRLEVLQLDAGDPLAAGRVTVVDGRAPRDAGEVAVTREVAEQGGLELGDVLALQRPDLPLTVVGTVEASRGGDLVALVVPGAVEVPDGRAGIHYLVDTPDPISWPDVLALNEQGYAVTSRAVLDDPPPRSEVPFLAQQDEGGSVTSELVTFVVLAAGMALLEVVLLAGPAVAVGARRSRRVLALVAACGGDRRQVRDVVLAQGLVLGGVAALVGVGAGVPLGFLGVALVNRYLDAGLPSPVVRPLDLLGLAVLAVVTAVLASLLPARTVSRQDTALALAGRREPLRTRKGIPVLGLAMAVGGLLVVLNGIERRSPTTILAGAALGQVGLVLCTPTLVLLTGRLGHLLPLAPRMALRDGVRHVGRTAPAVSAVMAAVAGSVAIGIFVASQAEHDRLQYTQVLPIGDAQVFLDPATGPTPEDVEDVLSRHLAVDDVVALSTVQSGPCADTSCVTNVYAEFPEENLCPVFGSDQRPEPTPAEIEAVRDDPRCASLFPSRTEGAGLGNGQAYGALVDDGTALAALTGRDVTRARTALAAGSVVVFDPLLLDAQGRALLRVERGDAGAGSSSTAPPRAVPAVAVESGTAHPGLVLSPALAAELGASASTTTLLVRTSAVPSKEQERAVNEALDLAGVDATVLVERGYQNSYLPGLLALVVGAAVITLGAAATATGLAMTDARPDLATLAAVGAARGVRRRLAMSTSLVITGIGTLLGVLAGAVPGIAAVRSLQQPPAGYGFTNLVDNGWPLVIPWPSLAVTVVAVPVLAALAAVLLTRGRLPMTRRVAA